MLKKLTLVAGFGAGYVLGAKAGKERYEQIMKQVNSTLGRPEVQEVTNNVSTAVTEKASQVKDTAKAKVEDLSDSNKDELDQGKAGRSTESSPIIGTGPIPGAAPSDTV